MLGTTSMVNVKYGFSAVDTKVGRVMHAEVALAIAATG
jgi:hypothetical protein